MAGDDLKLCTTCEQWLDRSEFYPKSKKRRCKACLRAECRAYYTQRMKDPLERERYNARQRERYPTYRAERLAEYRRNPEKNKAAVRAWQERNREKCILYACNHSARRRVAKESGMSGPDYRAWVLRQKKVCHWCGAKCAKQFEVDHIQPLARGGKHEPRNLAISCRTCNRSKSARDPIEWAQMLGKLL